MSKKNDAANQELEAQVLSAISAFEQILEAIPNDRASLDALANAYAQMGDLVKAKDCLLRLAQVLIDENDLEGAKEIKEQLSAYAEDDTQARQLLDTINKMSSEDVADLSSEPVLKSLEPSEVEDSKPVAKPVKVRTSFNMPDELAFAWNLLEADAITQEEYSSVVQDLTEMTAGDSNATVSVLHALEARGFKGVDKVLGSLSEASDTPLISLENFEVTSAVVKILPMELMVCRGCLIFDLIGNQGLAVVMNPYDKELRKDIEKQAGMKCHFYITPPSEFDHALEKMSEILIDLAAAEED